MVIDKNRVLSLYCNVSASIMNAGHNIVPSTYVGKYFNISRYAARKIIKSLVDQGLLESGIESGYSQYAETPYIERGYRLTKEAYKSEEYKRAQWHEAKICAQVWGGLACNWFKEFRRGETDEQSNLNGPLNP